MDKFSLIITAGGTSSRYGSKNKLLEEIGNQTVIEHTLSNFLDFENITEIVIPVNESIKEEFKALLKDNRIKFVNGGETRQKSVFNALQTVTNDYVMIHDGARPLITKHVISEVMDMTVKYSAVSVMTKTTDTIKEVNSEGIIVRTVDRSPLYNTQTPQAFKTELIRNAHLKFFDKNYTDDSSIIEDTGFPVHIIIGSYKNIKITTKSDLDFAKLYIDTDN